MKDRFLYCEIFRDCDQTCYEYFINISDIQHIEINYNYCVRRFIKIKTTSGLVVEGFVCQDRTVALEGNLSETMARIEKFINDESLKILRLYINEI